MNAATETLHKSISIANLILLTMYAILLRDTVLDPITKANFTGIGYQLFLQMINLHRKVEVGGYYSQSLLEMIQNKSTLT